MAPGEVIRILYRRRLAVDTTFTLVIPAARVGSGEPVVSVAAEAMAEPEVMAVMPLMDRVLVGLAVGVVTEDSAAVAALEETAAEAMAVPAQLAMAAMAVMGLEEAGVGPATRTAMVARLVLAAGLAATMPERAVVAQASAVPCL